MAAVQATAHMASSAPDPATALSSNMIGSVAGHDTPVPQQHHQGQLQRQRTPSLHGHTPPHQQSQPSQQSQLSQHQHQHPHQQQHQQQLQHQLQQQQPRSVKRPRPVKSCTECRKRKLRCDRLCPCSQCQKSNRACKYAAENELSNLSDVSDNEGPEPMRPSKRPCPPGSVAASGTANSDTAYPSVKAEVTVQNMFEDLSMRMDRLEKHVLVRSPAGTDPYGPRVNVASPDTIRGMTVKRGMLVTRFFGQNSPRILLNLFRDAKDFLSSNRNLNGARDVLSGFHQIHKALHDSYQKALAPITVFVDSMMPVQKRMSDIMPKKPVCDRLMAAYINMSESSQRILHLPSFSEQYSLYWEGKVQYESFVPQLLMVLAISSRFETKSKGLGHERSEGVHIPTACALVRSYLDGLKGKQLVDVTTIQVEILLLQAQKLISSRMEDIWTQLGQIVRSAMAVGLHRDPSEAEPRISVFVGELRRRLWYTLVELDMHTSLMVNLPCLIREGDFSCRSPRNLDDVDLYPDMTELPPAKPIDQATDNQQQVFAGLTLGIRMRVAHLLNAIDTLPRYDEVLEVGTKMETFLNDVNYMFPRQGIIHDIDKSKLWRTRVLLDMHIRRPLLALYRPLAMGAADPPAQISRSYLRSSMYILKYLDEIDPLIDHFQDIKEQYHAALKRDILQAAFSVCYYVRTAVRANASGMPGQHVLGLSPESHDDHMYYPTEDLLLWPLSRLITTVEKTLDLLIRHASGSDIKDIVCLATVLESVRVPEPTEEGITNGLRVVLDRCMRMPNPNMEKILSPIPGPPPLDPFQAERYGHGRLQFKYDSNNLATPSYTDREGWVLWDGWE